jgi:type I restriction enzyme S subunit
MGSVHLISYCTLPIATARKNTFPGQTTRISSTGAKKQVMNKQINNKIVPILRFPEFRDSENWKIELFGDLFSFQVTNSFTRDNLNYDKGSVKNIHYGDIHTKFSTLFDLREEIVPYINSSMLIDKIKLECYCIEGDMIFADASEDLDDVGKSIEIVHLNSEKLLSGMHTILARQKKPKLNLGFGGHLFMSYGIRTQIQKEAQGTKVLGISIARLSNIKVYYPQNKVEQKKITDSLSSIEDIVSAQSQKLEALKKHKYGLMQQLFPAEGETIPKLRFPEFRNDVEWVETTMEQVADYENGKAHENDISESGKFIVVNSKFISTDGKIKKFTDKAFCIAKKENILMVLSDLPNGRALAKCFFVGADDLYTVNQRICKITPIKAVGIMLYYTLNRNPYFLAFDDGVKQTNLKNEDVLHCPILLPKDLKEQQKIADCISSIDELIKTQGQKLDALKVHKKGLMQQLFPAISYINK